MQVTRIAYSHGLNSGKRAALAEQARRLGRVRAKVWREFGSIAGVGVTDRAIRDQWLADGTAEAFGVLANARKETLRDTLADITAHREAAPEPVDQRSAGGSAIQRVGTPKFGVVAGQRGLHVTSRPCCGCLGTRFGDRLHCTRCGNVWHADHAAAITILHRYGDPDISLHTSHQRVKRILHERDRRPEETPLPDSNPPHRRVEGETSLLTRSTMTSHDQRKGSR